MITRRRFVAGIGATALVPSAALAQPAKVPRVGVLHPGFATPTPGYAVIAFQDGLRRLGYVPGKTIHIDLRFAGGKPEALAGLAAELVSLKPSVIVTIGTAPTNAVKAVTGTIPIVATDTQTDPVASGLVASLSKPGGNVTGLFVDFSGLMGKLLELLRESVAGMRRTAVLWDESTGPYQLSAVTGAAKKLGIAVDVIALKDGSQIEAVLNAQLKGRPQPLVQLPSPVISQASARIGKLTLELRVPSISIFRGFPEGGGLMSYGPDLAIFFSGIAPIVHKILKGAKVGDIPIERPTTIELILNLQTAKALGLKVPQTVLLQATKIIE